MAKKVKTIIGLALLANTLILKYLGISFILDLLDLFWVIGLIGYLIYLFGVFRKHYDNLALFGFAVVVILILFGYIFSDETIFAEKTYDLQDRRVKTYVEVAGFTDAYDVFEVNHKIPGLPFLEQREGMALDPDWMSRSFPRNEETKMYLINNAIILSNGVYSDTLRIK